MHWLYITITLSTSLDGRLLREEFSDGVEDFSEFIPEDVKHYLGELKAMGGRMTVTNVEALKARMNQYGWIPFPKQILYVDQEEGNLVRNLMFCFKKPFAHQPRLESGEKLRAPLPA